MSIYWLCPHISHLREQRLRQLVGRLRQERPSIERLAHLERSVRRRIDERRPLQPRNAIEDWALRVLTPERRWASLTAAALSGLLAVGLGGAWVQPAPVAAVLSLQMFTSDAASPVYVLLKHQGKGSS